MKKNGKVMIIGPIGSGKSTLTKCLLNDSSPAAKTQALNYSDWIIDTPGEYSENPMFYRSLMATSLEAKILLVVQDATRINSIYPPNFTQGFPLIPIGVITKIDHKNADISKAKGILQQLIPNGEIYATSSITREGVEALLRRIQKIIFT